MVNDIRRWMRLMENVDGRFLASVAQGDQAERSEYAAFVKANGGNWEQGAELYAAKHKRSPDDIFGERERLNAFISKFPKFEFKTFGDEDWDNFWIISQHCDFDRNFQKAALHVIREYQGEEHSHFKYLSDRISCGLTGRQKYGTQDCCDADQKP